ncbi:MAG: amidohydrolase [Breznakibacter sp.]
MENRQPNLKIGFLQCHIVWEDTKANLERYARFIAEKEHNLDLFVLPEMFHCGFTMNPLKVAQSMHGEVVEWMKRIAQEHAMAVAGSVPVEEQGKYFNRFLFVRPDGEISCYDKRHLFRMAGEHNTYHGGSNQVLIEYKGWRIRPLICYDLRFPVWSRSQNNTDLIVYVANWPASRQEAWDVLLKARAIENQCYVLGVNRIGRDDAVDYSGGSAMIDPKGNVMSGGKSISDTIFYALADGKSLDNFRNKFPVYLDADDFSLC